MNEHVVKFKLRKSYLVAPKVIVSLVLTLVGMALVVFSFIELSRYDNSLYMNPETGYTLKKGSYYDCTFNSVLMKEMEVNTTDIVGKEASLSREYKIYTAMLSDGRYIQIKVYDYQLQRQIEKVVNGEQDEFSFKGKMFALDPEKAHLEWYDEIEGFNTGRLIKDVCIYERHDDTSRTTMLLGVVIMGIATILHYFSEGIQRWEKPTDNPTMK